jgi:hypothetical protein
MKKATYTGIIILLGVLSFVSCKKEYHCHCIYNNKLVYSEDLGNQTKKSATNICNSYDTTVPGEIWTCTID